MSLQLAESKEILVGYQLVRTSLAAQPGVTSQMKADLIYDSPCECLADMWIVQGIIQKILEETEDQANLVLVYPEGYFDKEGK